MYIFLWYDRNFKGAAMDFEEDFNIFLLNAPFWSTTLPLVFGFFQESRECQNRILIRKGLLNHCEARSSHSLVLYEISVLWLRNSSIPVDFAKFFEAPPGYCSGAKMVYFTFAAWQIEGVQLPPNVISTPSPPS